MGQRAFFIDKDGTLVLDMPYNTSPVQTVLLPGVQAGLKRLQEQGYALVVVSNQPGVARGLLSEQALAAYWRALAARLESQGIRLSGFYYCPHAPEDCCRCRKPGTALFERAASELNLELSASWMAGDILDDVEAGNRAGCRTVLINNGNETEWHLSEPRRPDLFCASLSEVPAQIERFNNLKKPGRAVTGNLARWQAARNILCVRLDSLGDVLMTSPAIRALKRSCNGRRITLLTSGSGAAAARLNRDIDAVIICDAPWVKGPAAARGPGEELLRRIRACSFEAAVIFTVYSQSALPAALTCYSAGIPLRLGYCRESPYELLSDWLRETEPQSQLRHEVQRQLDLVAAVGATAGDERIEVTVPESAGREVDDLLRQRGAGSRELIVIHPGATAPARRYPPGSFAQVLSRLRQVSSHALILSGSITEKGLLSEIEKAAGVPVVNMAGELDIVQFAALIRKAKLLISNNTGAVHVAAGAGTPVVDLYALTNPQHSPWLVPHRLLFHNVPCRFCYKSICPEGHQHCLSLVEPEAVVKAALELLNGTRDAIAADGLCLRGNQDEVLLC